MTLRVTIEIVPYGVEEHKRTLHTVNISNVGTVEHDPYLGPLCNYVVELDGKKSHEHWHYRKDGAITLAADALVGIMEEQEELIV